MPETPTAQFIRMDLFPANADIGTEVLTTVRVIVTDAHILIFKDSPTGPALIHSAVLEELSGDNKTQYTATTEDEQTITFKRSSGCGCGSRLRGFRPFPGVPYNARF